MWSQHTSTDRMAYVDRMRMAEIRGFLQSDDIDAQKNRLNFYLQELSYLNREQQTGDAIRLSELIANYVDGLNYLTRHDPMLQSLWLGVQTEIALAQIRAGELSRGFTLTKRLLDDLAANPSSEQHFAANLMVVLSHYIAQSLRVDNYAQLRLSLIGLEADCVASEACGESLTQLYANWAQQFWNQKDWTSASRILTEYTQLGINSQNSTILKTNAETAYVNQAKELLWDEDWETALSQLQICVDSLPGEQRCTQQIRHIKEQRHMGNL